MVRPSIAYAAGRFGAAPVTRFAPSPTGYLHLGHVVNAIYVWGIAQALGGSVRLRIEDHDRVRCRPDFEDALLEDLEWLGFLQLPATSPDRCRQRDREAAYEDALSRLRRLHHVYACDCSRTRIGGERYRGHCRRRRLPDAPGLGLRVRIDPGVEIFDDLLRGRIEQEPAAQCGDLLLRDRDGNWTYQFAVTADDLEHGVTLVIRGADLLDSTGRQLRLRRLLVAAGMDGVPSAPVYLHHPLLYGEDGRKLSKSTGATGVRALRRSGVSSQEVIGRAAAAAGLAPASARIGAADVAALFERRQPLEAQADAPAVRLHTLRTAR